MIVVENAPSSGTISGLTTGKLPKAAAGNTLADTDFSVGSGVALYASVAINPGGNTVNEATGSAIAVLASPANYSTARYIRGVYAYATSQKISGEESGTAGVVGECNAIAANSTTCTGYGLHGIGNGTFNDNGNSALIYGVYGTGVMNSTGTGTPSVSNYGVYGSATGIVSSGNGSVTNYGVYGTASGGTTNWAGYFSGAIYAGGDVTFADAKNIVFNTTTGTKIGTSTSDKLAFWNATPTTQPASADQTAITDSTGGSVSNATISAVGDTSAGDESGTINDNFAKIAELLNELRDCLTTIGLIKGSA